MAPTTCWLAVILTGTLGAPVVQDEDSRYRVTGRLIAPGGSAERQFGKAVAISDRWLAIASDRGEDGVLDPGSVLLYGVGVDWIGRPVRITAPDRDWPDEFGSAMEFCGRRLLVGAPGDSELGWDRGAAWIFRDTGSWGPGMALKPSGTGPGDRFGDSVAIDGSWIAVGAPRSDRRGVDSGAVHLFEQDGSRWVEEAVVVAPDGAGSDFFGDAVALQGSWLAVGAWADDDRGEKTGSVWIFRYRDGAWRSVQKLVPEEAGARARFGWTVAFTGEWLVVGSTGWNDDQGAIYAFRLEDDRWVARSRLSSRDGAPGDWLGFALGADQGCVVAGAPGRTTEGRMEGGIELFVLDQEAWRWRASLGAGRDGFEQPSQFGWSVEAHGPRVLVGRIDDADGVPEPGRAWLVERYGSPASTGPPAAAAR